MVARIKAILRERIKEDTLIEGIHVVQIDDHRCVVAVAVVVLATAIGATTTASVTVGKTIEQLHIEQLLLILLISGAQVVKAAAAVEALKVINEREGITVVLMGRGGKCR